MAIGVGDRIRPRLTSAALTTSRLQPQPPRIGVATRVSGGNVWGTFENFATLAAVGVPNAMLDKLTDPSLAAVRDAVIDKMAVGIIAAATGTTPELDYSAEFIGKVVDVYGVDPAGGGAPIDHVLIETTPGGMFYELPFASVRPLGNR